MPSPTPSTPPPPLRADSTKAAPTRNISFFISIRPCLIFLLRSSPLLAGSYVEHVFSHMSFKTFP